MQGKLALAAGVAAGYVLGSRAGRQRYEEIVASARRLWGSQTVQSTAGVVQGQANDLVQKARSSELVNKAKAKVGRGDSSSTDGGYGTDSVPSPTLSTDGTLSSERSGANGTAP